MSDSNIEEGLDRAETMVQVAYDGLKRFENGNGEKRMLGLINSISAARSVTWVLQSGLSDAKGFDEWYFNCQEILKDDAVCNRMVTIRNRITKEGDTGVQNYVSFGKEGVSMQELQAKMPPWADRFFLGGEYGGSGFAVDLSNGEEIKIYRDFPEVDAEWGIYFEVLRDYEEYNQISDAEEDLKYYIRVMIAIVNDARREFE